MSLSLRDIALHSRRARLSFLVSLVCLVGSSCAPTQEANVSETVISGPTMGTFFSVKIPGEHTQEQQQNFERQIQKALADVDSKMSTYREDSELSQLSSSSNPEPVKVSRALIEVLSAAGKISEMTGGAYDITIGPVVNAWGFGPRGLEASGLGPEEIEALLAKVGYQNLSINLEQQTVQKLLPDLYLDLSSIAKGYAVDRVAEVLASIGLSDYWVEVGGEVRVAGLSARGRLWRLGIERPQLTPGSLQKILPLDNMAVATSGDYRNYREIDGERFSHILDPRSGWPIRHRLASVSVVHPECMVADGLSTALLVMGLEEGYDLAVANDLAVFFLAREGDGFQERATPAFERLAQ